MTAWCYLLRPNRIELLTDPTELEREVVGEHLAHPGRLVRRGSLVLAGPSIAGDDTFGSSSSNARRTTRGARWKRIRPSCAAS